MLKFPCFGYLMWRANSLEMTLMLRKTESKRKRGQQTMRWLESTNDPMYMSLSKLQETVEDKEVWHAIIHGVTKSQTGIRAWKTAYSILSQYKSKELEKKNKTKHIFTLDFEHFKWSFGRLLKFETNYTKLWGIFALLCYKSWGKLDEGDQLRETSIFFFFFRMGNTCIPVADSCWCTASNS